MNCIKKLFGIKSKAQKDAELFETLPDVILKFAVGPMVDQLRWSEKMALVHKAIPKDPWYMLKPVMIDGYYLKLTLEWDQRNRHNFNLTEYRMERKLNKLQQQNPEEHYRLVITYNDGASRDIRNYIESIQFLYIDHFVTFWLL
jgi:hypothetical protein